MVLRAYLDPGEPRQRRAVPRHRSAPSPPTGTHRPGGPPSGARRKAFRSHRWRPPCIRGGGRSAHDPTRVRPRIGNRRPEDPGDPRQRRRAAVAIAQSGRPEHRGELVPLQRRHTVRGRPAEGAVSEIHRSRQQPRCLHAQHGRVAGDHPDLETLGATDHPRAPSVVAVPHSHMVAAVRRTDRVAGTADHIADDQHDRHGDGARTRGKRSTRCHPHGNGIRRVVSGLYRLPAGVSEHRRILDGDRTVSLRDTAFLHHERLPAESSRSPRRVALPEPVAGRMVAIEGCGGIHAHRLDVRTRLCGKV